MSSAQLDMFDQAPPSAAPERCVWTAEERRQVELALVGVYQELAVAAGLHSTGSRGHIAHASACEYIADEPRAAIQSGLSAVLGRVEPNACKSGKELGRAAWFRTLIAKVEGVPLEELPIDLAALQTRARSARAGAELDLTDPALAVVTHWPAGMISNGPMCEEVDCLACRRFR